jgi:hypothetical protein
VSPLPSPAPALWRSVRPHHAAAIYAGGAPKRASGGTWFSRALQLEIGGLSSCVVVAISRRRAKLGGRAPRGAAPGRHPPPDSRRWRSAARCQLSATASRRPAGPWQELGADLDLGLGIGIGTDCIEPRAAWRLITSKECDHLWFSITRNHFYKNELLPTCWSACLCGKAWAVGCWSLVVTCAPRGLAPPASRMAVGSSDGGSGTA